MAAAKPRPALTRGSLAAADAHRSRRRGTNMTAQSVIISDTASTISASQQSNYMYIPREAARLENTYKMAPDDDKAFSRRRVEDAMRSVLASYLVDYTYDATSCARLTCDLSNMVKARVKEMGFARYKLVCQVIIGENHNQGVHVVSRFLWDKKTDTYATATYSNGELYAVATVYGLYFE